MTTVATSFTPSVDASEMLAAAIEQMDGIIASTRAVTTPPPPPTLSGSNLPRSLPVILEELRIAAENEDAGVEWGLVDEETKEFFVKLLRSGIKGSEFDLCLSTSEFHEKIRRLENEKESLCLQVSVLSDQVDAQNEKIRDLEAMLQQERGKGNKIEEMLQQEMKLRSAMENQKLEVMSEMSKLKFSVSELEKEKFELEKKIFKAESEVAKLQRSIDHSSLVIQRGRKTPTQETNSEVEKMKKALESVMAANDEKDRKIDELRAATFRYKRIQEKMMENHRYGNEDEGNESQHYYTNKAGPTTTTESAKLIDKPPPAPRGTSILTSTPSHTKIDLNPPQLSPVTTPGRRSMSPQRVRSPAMSSVGSEESMKIQPPNYQNFRSPIAHYGTVPRNYAPALQAAAGEGSSPKMAPNVTHVKTFGKEFVMSERSSSRSTSAPNLAQTEIVNEEDENTNVFPELSKNKGSKGLKKFLGKLKRSNSQSIDGNESKLDDFRRGGLRATAGSRLGWSQNMASKEVIDVPFSRWDSEKIMAWVHELGLSSYISDVKRWVRSGDQLLHATPEDLEKELGIKNPLHRKKLILALQAKGSEDEDIFFGLDYHWVTRWLDDVGLPQYKDSFGDGRVDGRMLHYFTVEDLCYVHVSNLLHALSLKQGIQILRQHNFNPLCLKRRSAPDEPSTPPPSDVALWTNHRVMEWLRSVDLSEYAPNLRGSGVHGALMIYEDRFNAELLATLLSIPPTKTLLRRHLSMHFKELVGSHVMQLKREREMGAGYVPLTPAVKVKVPKKSQFSLRKKSKSDIDDYLCPMDGQSTPILIGSPTGDAGSPTFRTSSPISRSTSKGSPRLSTEGR